MCLPQGENNTPLYRLVCFVGVGSSYCNGVVLLKRYDLTYVLKDTFISIKQIVVYHSSTLRYNSNTYEPKLLIVLVPAAVGLNCCLQLNQLFSSELSILHIFRPS
mmetsp:Transcript_117864/g.240893  ORF Transcript_117864/g.240893 Transcript_117864/m.240893 type:complete len:105 (+) Transcript_117864:1425-1739(+)